VVAGVGAPTPLAEDAAAGELALAAGVQLLSDAELEALLGDIRG
jgi:hypothetical protein